MSDLNQDPFLPSGIKRKRIVPIAPRELCVPIDTQELKNKSIESHDSCVDSSSSKKAKSHAEDDALASSKNIVKEQKSLKTSENADRSAVILKLLRAANKARNMSSYALLSIVQYVKVKDLPSPTVMYIKEIHPKKKEDKSNTEGLYMVSFEDGRQNKKVYKTSIPAKVIEYPSRIKAPAIIVYLGTSTDPNGYIVHDLRRAECQGDTSEIKTALGTLRRMSEMQLRYFFDIHTIDEFSQGSVFVLESIKIMESGGVKNVGYPVVRYRTKVADTSVVGEMFLPLRCREEATNAIPCIMIFKGEKVSKKGLKYYNLMFISVEGADAVLAPDDPNGNAVMDNDSDSGFDERDKEGKQNADDVLCSVSVINQ